MDRSWAFKASLLVSGTLLLVVGCMLLFKPAAMHAANGVDLGHDPSLLSEVRAPGGALLALGILILAGAFRARLTGPAMMVAATVYGAYGLSRLLSMAMDGLPAPGIVAATGLEIAIGATNAALLARRGRIA